MSKAGKKTRVENNLRELQSMSTSNQKLEPNWQQSNQSSSSESDDDYADAVGSSTGSNKMVAGQVPSPPQSNTSSEGGNPSPFMSTFSVGMVGGHEDFARLAGETVNEIIHVLEGIRSEREKVR